MPVVTSDTPSSSHPAEYHAPIPEIAPPPSPWPSPSPSDPQSVDDESALTPASTDRERSLPGGDPEKVALVLGGLLVLVVSTLSLLARRTGRAIRSPEPDQRDAIAYPVARILVRHLPLDALNDDLVDGMDAVVATHGYLIDGPLIVSAEPPDVDIDVPDFIQETTY